MKTQTSKTIRTQLHTYRFDIGKAADAREYQALTERLNDGRHWFNVWAMHGETRLPVPDNSTVDVELDTECLFSNQWNTVDGCLSVQGWRVFDWYEGIEHNRQIKAGHYLTITDEMKRVRADTLKCGYCGTQYHRPDSPVFCAKCLDSPYLKPEDLKLLRLQPVGLHSPEYPDLTETERVGIMPLYVEQQTKGTSSRAVAKRNKERQDIQTRYERSTKQARTEYEGMVWLWEHNVRLDDVIYYTHTDTFSFGWRSKGVSPEVKSALLDVLVEFPFAYEIICTDGSKVSTR